MMNRTLLSWALLMLAGCAPSRLQGSMETVPVWGRWEESFTAAAPARNETALRVVLTAPSGRTRTVDGFWDGAGVWRVRFMPDEQGRWNFRTTSEPAAAGLHGRQGGFVVRGAGSAGNRFLRHGAVRVAQNGRYLAHADGTPFFWLGDTGWNGALKASRADWATYLADRVAKRFSAIQFVATQWRAGHTDAEGQVAYTGYQHIQINPAFFRRIDERVDAMNQAGLLAAPLLLWTLGDSLRNPGKLPEDQAIKLARYLVARYQGNHVVWILAGDENYARTGERWRRIGRAVFDRPDHAPVTLHPQGMQWHFADFAGERWLDLLIYQSGHGDDARTLAWLQTGPPAAEWQKGPARPVINSEPPYEDHLAYQSRKPHSAYNVRRAVYWSLLNAPTAGVTYGAHGIWSWETQAAVPLEHPNAGIARPWREALQLPGSEDMKHVADLFTSLEWWRLKPAPGLVQEQPEDPTRFIGAAASETRDLAVIYLPVGGNVRLDVGRFTSPHRTTWFDPRTGRRTAATPLTPGRFSAPDFQDWVLVLAKGQ